MTTSLAWKDLRLLYRDFLLNDIVPFWLRHAVDREHGGLLTCLNPDGSLQSTNKYGWSQCRAIWTFAALYGRVERNPKFLEIARATAEFVLRHGRDEAGRYVFLTTREGQTLQGAVSVYTDFFAAYGLGELFRATREQRYLDEALQALRGAMAQLGTPGFNAFAPYARPEEVEMVHGPSMIGLLVSQELAELSPAEDLIAFRDVCLQRIMDHHVRPERGVLLEHLGPGGAVVKSPAGRVVVPGHAIESMWFVLHHARRVGDNALVARALEVLRWMLEAGWDAEYGGLFLAVADGGGEVAYAHADKKLWWPHTEALYALLLACELTDEPWCRDWYWKIHEWAWRHYPVPEHGEWYQRLNRRGEPVEEVIALPVKDPFHLPRWLILGLEVLERLDEQKPSACSFTQRCTPH